MHPLILGIMAYFSKEDVNCRHSIQQKDGSIFSQLLLYIGSILLALRYFVSSYDTPSDIYTNMHMTSNSGMSHFVTSYCSYMVWAPSNYDMTS